MESSGKTFNLASVCINSAYQMTSLFTLLGWWNQTFLGFNSSNFFQCSKGCLGIALNICTNISTQVIHYKISVTLWVVALLNLIFWWHISLFQRNKNSYTCLLDEVLVLVFAVYGVSGFPCKESWPAQAFFFFIQQRKRSRAKIP